MRGTRFFALVVLVAALIVALPMAIHAGTEDEINGAWPTWITRKWTAESSTLIINYEWGSNLGDPNYLWQKGFQWGLDKWNASNTPVLFLQGTSNRSTLNSYWAADGYTGKTVPYVDSTLYLVRCDVLGNTAQAVADNFQQANYNRTGAHELGHCIGLGHPNSSTALMSPVHNATYNYPTQTDVDGVNQMYPRN